MSSLANSIAGRFWRDSTAERRSGNYAAMVTLGLLLAVNAALLVPRSAGLAVSLGDTPLTAELRWLPPPAQPVMPESAPEPQTPETRKLVSEARESARLTVPEPPAPPKIAEKPKPEPVKKAKRTTPEKRRKTPPAKAEAAPAPQTVAVDTLTPVGKAFGHASGAPEVKPDNKGAVLAALLHRVEANKKYPRQARRAGVQGKTILKVTIGPDGRVKACTLVEACGKTLLDDATKDLGASLVGLEIPPAHGMSISVLVPVHYILKRS